MESGIILKQLGDITATSIESYSHDYIWIVVVGFLLSFILSLAVGANDVANSFGTSVGSKVLTLTQACILATIFEILGAVLLGLNVVNTIRKGIVDIDIYAGSEEELMLGYLATLAGCAIWLFVATYFKLPVSASHSTVAATLGFTLAARGTTGVKWMNLGRIALSWVVSPLTSGAVSVIIIIMIEYGVMRQGRPLRAGLIAYPIIWGLTLFINVFGVTNKGPEIFYLDQTPIWVSIVVAVVIGFVAAVIVQIWIVPFMREKVLSKASTTTITTQVPEIINEKDKNALEKGLETPYHSQVVLTPTDVTVESATREETEPLFSSLQILTAVFASFAHGGNDVANSIGPLIALWIIFSEGTVNSDLSRLPTMGLLLFGGIGISVGLWILGRRVVETIGKNLTKIRPSTGFTIEIGSACTVLLASKMGLPVSTTHCKVGSVVFVGYADGKFGKKDETQSVNWKLFGGIAVSWVATIPAALGVSALIMWILKSIFI